MQPSIPLARTSRRGAFRARVATLTAALTLALWVGPVRADSLVVTIDSGQIQGIVANGGAEWRGIPYAAPPVGGLRWQAPQPVAPWAGVRDGSSFGPHCMQLGFPDGIVGSEDCLYLNIFAPPGTTNSSGLAVMVHLHGGSNTFGWGYEDAHGLVEHGVIVVTLNYRLGVFGSVGHPALTAEGDLPEQGLLDQLAALR